jgi:hypothetical protein
MLKILVNFVLIFFNKQPMKLVMLKYLSYNKPIFFIYIKKKVDIQVPSPILMMIFIIKFILIMITIHLHMECGHQLLILKMEN